MLVHLIDGTFELFRYFLSPAAAFDRSAPEELRAVRGVVASILGMLEGGATHLGVATDHVIESFRNALWPGHTGAPRRGGCSAEVRRPAIGTSSTSRSWPRSGT